MCARRRGPPPPVYGNLEVSPSSHDFGETVVGQKPILQGFILKNTGDAEIVISQIYLSDNTDLSLDTTGVLYPCSTNNQALQPDDLCTIVVKYNPSQIGELNAKLIIESNDTVTPIIEVPISGLAKCNPVWFFSVDNKTYDLFEGIIGVPSTDFDHCTTTVNIDIQHSEIFPLCSIDFWVSIDEISYDWTAVEKPIPNEDDFLGSFWAEKNLIKNGAHASYKAVFHKPSQIVFTLSITNPKAYLFTIAEILLDAASPVPIPDDELVKFVDDISRISSIDEAAKHFSYAAKAILDKNFKEARQELKIGVGYIKKLAKNSSELLAIEEAYLKINIQFRGKQVIKVLSKIPTEFIKILADLQVYSKKTEFNTAVPLEIIVTAE